MAQKPGYDPLMQAFSGIMSMVGEPDGGPVRVGPSIVDMGAGMWAALGIVSALLRRNAVGEGACVDVSLFETATSWMTIYTAQYLASGQVPARNGSGQAGIVPYRAYATADGALMVAAGNNALFKRLCKVLEEEQWPADPRFADNPQRVAHAQTLNGLIEAHFVRRSSADWTGLLDAAGVPCAPVQNVAAMVEHAQTQAMGILQPAAGSSIALTGLPVSFDGVRPAPRHGAPALDNCESAYFSARGD